jgi:hypothetical protein
MASNIYSQVRQALRNTALKALELDEYDVPVLFSHSNGPEPAESYVVINIVDLASIGKQSSSTLTDTQEQLTIINNYEVRAQFSFCGSLSGDMVMSFVQRIGANPLVHQEARRNNLGFMRKSSIRRAPQKRETQWVEFQNLDVTFSYAVRTDQLIDVIDTVILQNEVSGEIFTVPEGVTIP